jgi:hypothetical protein
MKEKSKVKRPKEKKQSTPKPKGPGVAALNELVSAFKDALKVQGYKLKDMTPQEIEDHFYSFLEGAIAGRPTQPPSPVDEEEMLSRGFGMDAVDGDDG